jgi:trigger factor
VLAEVGRINNLQVTQEELNRAMMAEARRYPGQERKVLDFFKEHPHALEGLAGPILEEKVIDFILEMGSVTERRVASEELLESEEKEAAPREPEDGPEDGDERQEQPEVAEDDKAGTGG